MNQIYNSKWKQSGFQAFGICSPYLAVLAGVFWFRNAFGAVLFYHAVLLVCILNIGGLKPFKQLTAGFNPILSPLMCLGALVPGAVILFLWPVARLEQVDLSEILQQLNLDRQTFWVFLVYSCIVNPLLEEGFWRGCFLNRSFLPTPVDALFAGYHALAVFPVLKWPFAILIFAAMTGVGWLFRLLYRINSGLLTPLLMHIIADIAILFAIWRLLA